MCDDTNASEADGYRDTSGKTVIRTFFLGGGSIGHDGEGTPRVGLTTVTIRVLA